MGILKYENTYIYQRDVNRNVTKGLNLLEKLVSDDKVLAEDDTEHLTKLIEHHTKYLEIDGVDETVFITRSKHATEHVKMRMNKVHIPIEITRKAYERTEKRKEYLKNFWLRHPYPRQWKNREPVEREKCPFCKGDNTTKRGKTCGKQRFMCKDCKRYFTLGINYRNEYISRILSES